MRFVTLYKFYILLPVLKGRQGRHFGWVSNTAFGPANNWSVCSLVHCVSKNGHPFCFCNNFVSRGQIFVIFGSLVAKEICNRT